MSMMFLRSPLQPCSNGDAALAKDEELLHALDGVGCSVARQDPEEGRELEAWGRGALRITSQRALWQRDAPPPADAADPAMGGFAVRVRHVGLHAITRDPETFPEPCLYAQLLLDDFPEDPSHPTELFFAPADGDALQGLFDAFSRAAMLNPDSDEEEDDDDAMISMGDDGALMRGVGLEDDLGIDDDAAAAMLRRFDDMLTVDPGVQQPALPAGAPGQFDDADEGGGDEYAY